MKLSEVTGEYMPYDESTAMKIAKDLYRGSNGDIEKAKQMLRYLVSQVEANIDKHAELINIKRI